MRIAVAGAAAAAVLGGLLAVTPLTTVSTPMPGAATCANGGAGAGCEKLASVLMPESPKPAPAPAAQAPAPLPLPSALSGPTPPATAAANLTTPGATSGTNGSSASRAMPGVDGPDRKSVV